MAFSKLSSSAALFRTVFRCCENGLGLRTCGVAFRQTDYAIRHIQVQMVSTTSCLYERHFVRRSSAFFPKFGGRVNSTDKSSSSNTTSKLSETTASEQKTDKAIDTQDDAKLGVFQRFKNAYKQHGKILIGVHLATSIVWYSTFWYTVHVGVDVVSFFERLGVSDRILKPMRHSGAGDFAVAYLMYKLATPARYTVTLAGTNYMIRYLRKTGKMAPQKEKMRDLIRDSQKGPHMQKMKYRLKTIETKSRSRVQSFRGRSQRRMVQLRKLIRSRKKKS